MSNASFTDESGTVRLKGKLTQAASPALPTGWTEDAANPANVETHGANLSLDNGQVSADATGTGGGYAQLNANGVRSLTAFAQAAFSTDGSNGATVAFDAGGLLVKNCAPIQIAAGVPVGAPTSLPFALDTTAVTGGLYAWNGAAWVKVSTIP